MVRLKYRPRLKIWRSESKHISFDPATCTGLVYGHKVASCKINGALVLNCDTRYSSDRDAYFEIKRICEAKGIRIDYEINSAGGLKNLYQTIESKQEELLRLERRIMKPRIRQTTRQRLLEQRDHLQLEIIQINELAMYQDREKRRERNKYGEAYF